MYLHENESKSKDEVGKRNKPMIVASQLS